MNINNYLLNLETTLNDSSIISAYKINIDRKTADIVFIAGEAEFRDGSILDFKEFIESAEKGIEKYKYAYNYRTYSGAVFRYDNASDPNAKKLKTFPHHRHLENGSITESHPVELADVLNDIEEIFIKSEH